MMVADWGTTLMHHAPELRGEQRIAPAIAYGASAPQAAAPRERLLWVDLRRLIVVWRAAPYGASFRFPLATWEVGYLNGHRPFRLGGGNGSKCPIPDYPSRCLAD